MQAASFVKEHMDIVRVKLQCEAALKVWDRLKFSVCFYFIFCSSLRSCL